MENREGAKGGEGGSCYHVSVEEMSRNTKTMFPVSGVWPDLGVRSPLGHLICVLSSWETTCLYAVCILFTFFEIIQGKVPLCVWTDSLIICSDE